MKRCARCLRVFDAVSAALLLAFLCLASPVCGAFSAISAPIEEFSLLLTNGARPCTVVWKGKTIPCTFRFVLTHPYPSHMHLISYKLELAPITTGGEEPPFKPVEGSLIDADSYEFPDDRTVVIDVMGYPSYSKTLWRLTRGDDGRLVRISVRRRQLLYSQEFEVRFDRARSVRFERLHGAER